MTTFERLFKTKMTRFVILLFAGLILVANTGLFLLSAIQFNQETERQTDALIDMLSHLIIYESAEAARIYVEHYDHTHGVNITYYDSEGVLIYQSTTPPTYQARLPVTDDDGVLLGEVIVDFHASLLGKDLMTGLVHFNLLSLLLLMLGLLLLSRYIHRQYRLVAMDMNMIGKQGHEFRFHDIISIHERYQEALRAEQSVQEVQAHHIKILAHDVKTPLTVMKTYLEGIQNERILFDPEVNRDLLKEIKAIEDLVPRLMVTHVGDVARKQDIAVPIRHLLDKLSDVFSAKNITLDATIDSMQVEMSLSDLTRLVEHLVFNAFYYSPPGSTVRVILSQHEQTLIVKDEGIGMSKETLKQVRMGSYRAPEAIHCHKTGSGIGLQIVFSIIKHIKGDIKIESEPGKGTTVTVLFR